MERVKVKDKFFVKYIPHQDIDKAIDSLADRLNEDYMAGEAPLVVMILTGGFIFMSDLVRKLNFDMEISHITASSYIGDCSTGNVVINCTIHDKLKGRNVIVVDDIADSGQTLQAIKEQMLRDGAVSVKSAVLINKPHAHKVEISVDYAAIVMPENNFIIGYGLDYDGYGRGLKDIYIAE